MAIIHETLLKKYVCICVHVSLCVTCETFLNKYMCMSLCLSLSMCLFLCASLCHFLSLLLKCTERTSPCTMACVPVATELAVMVYMILATTDLATRYSCRHQYKTRAVA